MAVRELIADAALVADAHIEEAIGPEHQMPGIVIRIFVELIDQDQLAVGVGAVLARHPLESRQAIVEPAVDLRNVEDEDVPALRRVRLVELRVGGETDQSRLAAGHGFCSEVQERARPRRRTCGDAQDQTVLLRDEVTRPAPVPAG